MKPRKLTPFYLLITVVKPLMKVSCNPSINSATKANRPQNVIGYNKSQLETNWDLNIISINTRINPKEIIDQTYVDVGKENPSDTDGF